MKSFTKLLLIVLSISTAANAQYCMLPGRTIYSAKQPGITNFKLSTIDRTSSNVEKPLSDPSIVLTTDSTELEIGKTYVFSITHSRDDQFFPNARNNVRMWIDYDQNTDFTGSNEEVNSKDFLTYGTYTDSFTIPANAKLGWTRLRVTAKMSSDAGHTIPTPCDVPKDPIDYHGEMEDYHVKIVPPASVKVISNTLEANIYPNPTNDNITVVLNNNSHTNFSIDLYDITGKLISNIIREAKQTTRRYNFNMNDYTQNAGVYLIKLSSGNNTAFQRITKTN